MLHAMAAERAASEDEEKSIKGGSQTDGTGDIECWIVVQEVSEQVDSFVSAEERLTEENEYLKMFICI